MKIFDTPSDAVPWDPRPCYVSVKCTHFHSCLIFSSAFIKANKLHFDSGLRLHFNYTSMWKWRKRTKLYVISSTVLTNFTNSVAYITWFIVKSKCHIGQMGMELSRQHDGDLAVNTALDLISLSTESKDLYLICAWYRATSYLELLIIVLLLFVDESLFCLGSITANLSSL